MTASSERRVHVPASSGVAVQVHNGDVLRLTDLQGKQVADFFAFRADDIEEALSPTHTRTQMLGLHLKVGDLLYSNARKPMFELIADTVGRHDLLVAPCDRERYATGFNLPDHANCRNNCYQAMQPYGLTYARVPDAHNFFMNVEVDASGAFAVHEPLSKAGDYVELRALMDLIVAVSACPQDLNETNGFNPTDLEIKIRPG
jgi:uncharacterized protein